MKNRLSKIIPLLLISVILIISLFGCGTTQTAEPTTRVITDMFGRELTVPATINRVLATSPIEMELVYLIAPEKLCGLVFNFNGDPPLAPAKYTSLPVVGGWYGTQTGNYENFIATEPDIIIEGTQANIEERQEKFGSIPVVGIYAGSSLSNMDDDALTKYENEIRFLGELLDAEEQAASLITYYNDAMNYVNNVVAGIPDDEKIKVYYAEGKDGLSTDPTGSMHTRLLIFCGGINVAEVPIKSGYGMAETSLEQILMWDPDMIIIGRGSQAALYQTVMTDSKWSELRAVKNGQVFLRPTNPYSWFDGPPGPCQIIGMYWMVHKLYPDKTTGLALEAKVKEFYAEFLHHDLTDAELAGLLAEPY